MSTEVLIRRCHEFAGLGSDTEPDADSLIGLFQQFRPDGVGIEGLFEDLDVGETLEARLAELYSVGGDDRRPQGGRDAYFVIRKPAPLDPERARHLAQQWLEGLRDLAISVGDAATADVLDPLPGIRVLEGVPPKHPRNIAEKSNLLLTIQEEASHLVDRIDAGPYPPVLRPAYYFTACDSMLRDYLMWPLYAEASGLREPFKAYFDLWRHGIKYRIFGETQVDLYLPRQHD